MPQPYPFLDALLRDLCVHSYQLVFSRLTKKLQREISGE